MVLIVELEVESEEKMSEDSDSDEATEAEKTEAPKHKEKSKHYDESEDELAEPEEKEEVEEAKAEEHHNLERYTIEEEVKICEFMHKFTHDPKFEDVVEKFRGPSPNTVKFWKMFVEATGSTRNVHGLQTRYRKLMSKLHNLPISTEMKLDLYYSLSFPVHEEFMETVKQEANFSMDKDRNLEAFEMKSEEQLKKEKELLMKKKTPKKPSKRRSSLAVKDVASKASAGAKVGVSVAVAAPIPEGAPAAKRPKTIFTQDEDVTIWKFLLGKITDIESNSIKKNKKLSPKSVVFWREFLGKDTDAKVLRSYINHFDTMIKHLHKMPLSLRNKADLHYGLDIPVSAEFLKLLSKKGDVKTDGNGCILEYNSEDFDVSLFNDLL